MLCNCCKTGLNADCKIWSGWTLTGGMFSEWHMCAVMKNTGSSLASLLSTYFQGSIVITSAFTDPHWLHHCWVASARSWKKIRFNWSSQEWANWVSTCQLKQFHVMNEKMPLWHLSFEMITSFSLGPFCVEKRNTSRIASLTEDTVSPSGSLLQLQSFVHG